MINEIVADELHPKSWTQTFGVQFIVRYFGKQIYAGAFTAKVLEQFTSLLKRSIASSISDMISTG
ncbi:MAG: hypothetical protein LBH34_03920 [Prevotellaceae bacterium]|nr:hypothetical protein [Prevotellaceae bacterium]